MPIPGHGMAWNGIGKRQEGILIRNPTYFRTFELSRGRWNLIRITATHGLLPFLCHVQSIRKTIGRYLLKCPILSEHSASPRFFTEASRQQQASPKQGQNRSRTRLQLPDRAAAHPAFFGGQPTGLAHFFLRGSHIPAVASLRPPRQGLTQLRRTGRRPMRTSLGNQDLDRQSGS